MLDMGPYYLTAMVNLLGPIKRIAGITGKGRAQRKITSEPFAGQVIDVEVSTHVTGTLEFANGTIGTMITSFDVTAHHLPKLEVHGTEGSISVPDPNTFGGPVSIFVRETDSEWREVELTHTTEIGRGTGLADLAKAERDGRAHRASGDLALHVLEAMTAFDCSSEAGEHVTLETSCERPAALPAGLAPGELD
jgi:predicted dehydrogenase